MGMLGDICRRLSLTSQWKTQTETEGKIKMEPKEQKMMQARKKHKSIRIWNSSEKEENAEKSLLFYLSLFLSPPLSLSLFLSLSFSLPLSISFFSLSLFLSLFLSLPFSRCLLKNLVFYLFDIGLQIKWISMTPTSLCIHRPSLAEWEELPQARFLVYSQFATFALLECTRTPFSDSAFFALCLFFGNVHSRTFQDFCSKLP